MKPIKNTTTLLIFSASALLGGLTGYIYYVTIGCNSGTCPLTSGYTSSIVTGIIIGLLIGDTINSYFKKRKERINK